jgi:hypothetical protein
MRNSIPFQKSAFRYINFIHLVLVFTISACSDDENDCNNTLEPIDNSFTIDCNSYETPIARSSINQFSQFATTGCKIQLVNSRGGNEFDFQDDDTNINYIDIWLIIPSSASTINSVPDGTYTLKKLDNSINEQYVPFDIANRNVVIYNGFVEERNGQFLFSQQGRLPTEFDEITLNVNRSGDIYTIIYTMVVDGKTVKGRYVGNLEIIDNWT